MSHDSSLEPALRAVEPATRLVPERHLLEIVNFLTDRGHPLPTNPNLPFWVSRADLEAAEPKWLPAGAEPALLLLVDPHDRMIDHLPRAEQLRAYWRVLFQARVMWEIDRKLASGALTAGACGERLNRFGPGAVREIRYVLEAEHLADPETDDAGRYRAFAAAYLDLATFDGAAAGRYFPSLPHGDAVRRVLAGDVDAAGLLPSTRPEGAADPHREPDPDERWTSPDTHLVLPPRGGEPRGALGAAHEAEAKGNFVRAAILRTQAAAAGGEAGEQAVAGAYAALGKLVAALGEMFHWDDGTRREWHQALGPLLAPAAAGIWPRAARCLYELQKLPADLSREVFAVDLPEVIRTFGRRPLKRPLPRAKPVLILMGLKKAHAQMRRVGLGHAARLRLDRLFHHQAQHLEHDIRRDLTPVVTATLTESGLVPANTVEAVGREKLVAELLDRVCDRGYLRLGDLRDAVARNRLKLPDLRGPGEFLRGDPLLKADSNLSYALDGVYRRGEFYLRWLQRLSSLFFANPVGRAVFLYLLLPFAAGFMTVVFAQEMAHLGGKAYTFLANQVNPKPVPGFAPQLGYVLDRAHGALTSPAPRPHGSAVLTADKVAFDPETGEPNWQEEDDPPPPVVHIPMVVFTPSTKPSKTGEHGFRVPWAWVGGLAALTFLCLHVPAFRRGLVAALGHLWRAVRGLLWDLPMGVWRSPAVRGFRQSRPIQFLHRYFWSPLLIAAILFGVLFLFGVSPRFLLRWGWAIWAGLTIAYNTPWGWVLQDRIAEAVSDWWRVVRVNLIPGLIATIIDWFRMLANWVERQLYAVDERLRFRGGDSQGSLALKAGLGLLWFPVAYVTRFAFNLLIEPQVNPVKHFPVVTVSHKMMLPLVLNNQMKTVPTQLGQVLVDNLKWQVAKANFWAFWGVACIPGIFGFTAWELLSNWRLYRANRPARLRPVTLGSHGESMRGLLRPGFHSGTVPKLFRKLRHADGRRADRLHHDLEHAAEAVHHFVERELVHLLERSPDWGGVNLRVAGVRFGCQRATVELAAQELGKDAFVLAFENVRGGIEVAIERVGWADKLTEGRRATFVAALRGILDMAAVERIHGRNRSEDIPAGPGFADLARPTTWVEWVARWDTKREARGEPPG